MRSIRIHLSSRRPTHRFSMFILRFRGLQARGFLASDFLPSSLCLRRFSPGRVLRGFLAFGFQLRGFGPRGFLTSSLCLRRFSPGDLLRGFQAFRFRPRGLDPCGLRLRRFSLDGLLRGLL